MLDQVVSALANLLLLAGIPFFVYAVFHKVRHRRTLRELAGRSGLQLGDLRYVAYCAIASAVPVLWIALWPPPLEGSVSDGSAFQPFYGLGLSTTSLGMALLYGIVKTGFAEEFLFRGLISGSLGRRMPLGWANSIQATIFLLPHLFVLVVSPEMWPILPLVYVGALLAGWARIKSGSMLGPWLLHAAVNVTMALSVAARSAG